MFAMPPGTDDPDILAGSEIIEQMIADATGKEVQREMPEGVVEAVRQGQADVALMSPFSTALAVKYGSVAPWWSGRAMTSRRRSAIHGRTAASTPSLTSPASRLLSLIRVPPQAISCRSPLLADNGLTDGEDYEFTFAGGHDSAMLAMSAYLGVPWTSVMPASLPRPLAVMVLSPVSIAVV
ncbi:ABC transporter, phosphonate, substrate-binding protein [Arthrobacter sp. VKM Ac-2550]|nr:ABC transporter, phosphonate, substrate-binding protein [Arthrobacter sp. VKM Ac-2550]